MWIQRSSELAAHQASAVDSTATMLKPVFLLLMVSSLMIRTSDARPLVIELNDKNFEHQTQASTGQTTGIWYVLFTGHTVFVSDWEEIAKDYREIDPTVIFAYVDLAANPGLRNRFDIKQLPQAYLFRERKMHIYSGSWGPEDLDENLKDFVSIKYASTPALAVPPPESPLSNSVQKLLLEHSYILVGAAIALLSVLAYSAFPRQSASAQGKKGR